MTRTILIWKVVIAASAVLLIAPYAIAKTVVVGTCIANLRSYTTISLAVSAVEAESTILVCPGNYPEQVTITQPLTLRGVQSGNSGNPTITVPPGGLTKSVLLANGITMFYQVSAQATDSSAVNISNIGIDGSNNAVTGIHWLAAILYQNASGNVSHAATFNQKGNGYGFGIFLESSTASSKTISINQSSIHDYDAEGIRSNATHPTALTVSIKGNSVSPVVPTPQSSGAAIDIDGIGMISGNRLISRQTSSGIGVAVLSGMTISNNTVVGFGIGIWPVGDSVTITSNKISLATAGIVLSGTGHVVQHNSIFDTINGGAAIQFGCDSKQHTIIHNVINDSLIGIIHGDSTNVISPNAFSNVERLTQPAC